MSRVIVCIVFYLCSDAHHAYAAPSINGNHNTVIRRPFENLGATIAWGYDSRSGEFKAPCVKHKDKLQIAPVTGPGGEASEQQFRIVDSYEDVSSALGLDFSASARYFIGTAGGSFKLTRNMKLSSYSSTAILHMSLEKAARFAEKWEPISVDIKQLARNPLQFRSRCGDSFVYLVIEGGELNASISATGATSSEQEKIEAAFAAATLQYKVDGKLDVALASMRATSQLDINNYTRGGMANFTDAEINNLAKNFYANARANPWALELRTLGYENVAGLPLVAYQTAPTQISSCIFELYQFDEGLSYIAQNKKSFNIEPDQIRAEREKVAKAISWLKGFHEKNVSTWSKRCPSVPSLPSRTHYVDLNINVCGWNQLPFLPASDSGWSTITLGSWCASRGECHDGGRAWTDPGKGFELRCDPEGPEGLKKGPCHMQSSIRDYICADNEPKRGHEPQIEISEKLPVFDLEKYQREANAVLKPEDLK